MVCTALCTLTCAAASTVLRCAPCDKGFFLMFGIREVLNSATQGLLCSVCFKDEHHRGVFPNVWNPFSLPAVCSNPLESWKGSPFPFPLIHVHFWASPALFGYLHWERLSSTFLSQRRVCSIYFRNKNTSQELHGLCHVKKTGHVLWADFEDCTG